MPAASPNRWPKALFFVLVALGAMLVNLPATWLPQDLGLGGDRRLLLADAQGTWWQGSAVLALKSGSGIALPLPGRLHWQWGLGAKGLRLALDARESGTFAGTVELGMGWQGWQVAAGEFNLPAQALAGLGAPFNTLQLEGPLNVRWNQADWAWRAANPSGPVAVEVKAQGLRSRLSPVAPLGSYHLRLDWGALGARVSLDTESGPLMLSGNGNWTQGRLAFDGQASASAGLEPQLIGLLSILGKREGAVTRLHI